MEPEPADLLDAIADLTPDQEAIAAALRDLVDVRIEAGDLIPWADTPETPTPPAEPVQEPPADPGPHPDTPQGALGVLGRALLDAAGDPWLERDSGMWQFGTLTPRSLEAVEQGYGQVRLVLLVQPAAAAVLEAARDLVGQQRHPDPDTGQAEVADAGVALAAAVDALDQPDDPTPTTGAPFDTGLPPGCLCHIREDIDWGDVRTPPRDGCPVHPVNGPLTEPEPLCARCGGNAFAAWLLPTEPTIGGPDHDGLTGARVIHDRPGDFAALMGVVRTAQDRSAEAALEPDATCDYEWWANDDDHICREPAGHAEDHVCPCGAHRMPPDAPEPALEPAGDGPGWDRSNVERIISMVMEQALGASGDGDQLRALLADRDRQEVNWKSEAHRMLAVAEERDAARADRDQQARVAANLFELAERRFVALELARAELATERARAERAESQVARLQADPRAVLDDHELCEIQLRSSRADVKANELRIADILRRLEDARAEAAEVGGAGSRARAERDKALRLVALRDSELAEAHRRDALCKDVEAERDRLHGVAERAMAERRDTTAEVERLRALLGDSIDPATIPDQHAKSWTDWHPERYCHRCGRRNISWYADSAVWNEVHGGSGPIWCPVCFVLAHEEVTSRRTSWRLAPADRSDEVGALIQSEAAMRHEHNRVVAELAEMQQLFELQWRRTAEATALWRAEAPEQRALIQPDLGALLRWLMDRADVASRDAAADALDWAREQLDPSQTGAARLPLAVLGRIAAEIRSGQRPVPGSPEPASSEEAS